MADDEEEVGDYVSGLFRLREMMERTRVARRSSGARRRGSGMAMDMTMATAVLGMFGGKREREQRRRKGSRESERGVRGVRGIAGGVQGDEGAARQAAVSVARRGTVAGFSSAFWREEEDNWQGGGWAGPASTAGRTGRWAEVSARLVLLSLSLPLSLSLSLSFI